MNKESNIDNIAIGKRIREEREKLGLSRESFAELVGLSPFYVGQLERGERQMSLPVIGRVSYSLHLVLDYLVYGEISANGTFNADHGSEIEYLLKKCSPKELELISQLVKTILPYISK